MGKIKYLSKIKEFFEKTPAFLAKDVELIVKNKKYAHLLLHNLCKKGNIFRLTKGCYTFYEDPIFSVFCFKPAYLGLQEALSLHNLWEQETNPIVLTTKKVRKGIREVLNSNLIVYHLPPKYFFGFELLSYGNFFIPVSDLEKTLIDLVYFKEIPSKEVIKEIRKKIQVAKLNSYLKRYPLEFRKIVNELVKNTKVFAIKQTKKYDARTFSNKSG